MCPLCADTGWIQAAAVIDLEGFERSSYVGEFHPIPCFVSYPHNVKVLIP